MTNNSMFCLVCTRTRHFSHLFGVSNCSSYEGHPACGGDGASIGQRYLCPTCRENPDPNAASGRKNGGIPAKKYELCLRLDPAEAQRLSADSKRCGLSKTAYLRQLILGAELKARPSPEIKALRTEIHHIGNNVNQIARRINAGFGRKEDAEQIKYLLGEVYRLMYEIAKE